MNKIIVLVTLFFCNATYGLVFEITKLCSNEPYLKQNVEIILPTNVLEFSTYMFNNYMIPHQVTENGVASILDTPTGYAAYEFVSESHMRVYGWCYEVNGRQPSVVAANYTIDPRCQDHVRWFYGYAEIVDGQWTTYCRPVYLDSNPFICAKY